MTSSLDLSKIYTKTKMKRIVAIPASDLNTMFDENLLNTLRTNVEGKCNREGYIEKGSVEIINHGTLNTEVIRYRGDVRVKVNFTAKVVNPVKGDIIECKIKRFNQFGIMAFAGPLNIVIPFENKEKNINFNIGQILKVEIVESDIVLNQNQIDVYAKFYDKKIDNSNNKSEEISDLVIEGNDEDEGDEGDEGDDIDDIDDEIDEGDDVDNESDTIEGILSDIEDPKTDEEEEGEGDESNGSDNDDNDESEDDEPEEDEPEEDEKE
jgi:DNA-directed RNA polymerase subunit E'/Rpb7